MVNSEELGEKSHEDLLASTAQLIIKDVKFH